MKRALFFLAYAASVAVPVVLYLLPLGGLGDAYSASVALGAAAFAVFANQFLLAARPAPVAHSLGGMRGLLKVHHTMPMVGLALVAAHRVLKGALGMDLSSVQARFGQAAVGLILLSALLALFLLANTFLMRVEVLKDFKARFHKRTGIGYQHMRLFHNLVVVAVVLALVHALLASTGDWTANPWGIGWLSGWLLVCLGFYGHYRFIGRRSGVSGPGAISKHGT